MQRKLIVASLLLVCAFCFHYDGYNATDPFNWGLYKPQLIHGISQAQNNPLTISQAYFHNKHAFATLRYEFPKRKSDKIIYNYRINTGVGNYASQDVYDPLLNDLEMRQNYIRLDPTDWIDTTRNIVSRSNSTQEANNNEGYEVGFIYAIAFENFEKGNDTTHSGSVHERSLFVANLTDNQITIVSNDFQHKIIITGQNIAENISFRGIASDETKNWKIEKLLSKVDYKFTNQAEANSTVIFIKTAVKLNVGAELQVYYTPFVDRTTYAFINDAYITNALDPYFQNIFENAFDVKTSSTPAVQDAIFSTKYQFETVRMLLKKSRAQEKLSKMTSSNKQISESEMKCASQSFSNLMGGIQYSYGNLLCIQPEETCVEKKPLFTTTPSRYGFPRPFLWDDGFHQMLSCQWDPEFCKQDIEKWFQTISAAGWIPREQPRGPELRSYIPGLFEDNRDGNPPSFLFNLLYISSQLENQEEYIQRLLPQIESWFGWWMNIQRVPSNSTDDDVVLFKWWGPNEDLNLGSGMDDWPRVDVFDGQKYISKYNVDASAWAYFFSQSLAVLSKNSTYAQTAEKIKQSIHEVLLDHDNLVYYDYLYNVSQTASGQNVTKYHLSTHLGYPNFVPLMVGVVDDVTVLEKQLEALLNDETLWTPYGIRSLSIKDDYFGVGSNYWRGPIWINMQYLLLRSMKKFYWDVTPLAQTFYEKLRTNVISTVCGQFESRGYFFEHFNQDLDGKGKGNHPFNGWTSLITLIVTESYV